MPSAICKHPTCFAVIALPGFCDAHADQRRAPRSPRDRFYDQHLRDPRAKAFYNSSLWLTARADKLAADPVCEQCSRAWAEHVHHRKPLAECSTTERTAREILMSVCPDCHNALEAELQQAKAEAPP